MERGEQKMTNLEALEAKIEGVSARLKEGEDRKTRDRERLREEWIALVGEADLLRPEEDEKKWNKMYPNTWWGRDF